MVLLRGKTTYKGNRIDGITSQFGQEKLIHEPTHIINFYNQPIFPC